MEYSTPLGLCPSAGEAGLLCRDVDGGSACLPAAQACGFTNAACQSSGDCCSPLQCLPTGLCGSPCDSAGQGCQKSSDCCTGLVCGQGQCLAPCGQANATCCTGLICQPNGQCEIPFH